LVLILVFTAVLAAYHWYRGATVESAIRMTIDDYRVAASCPNKPEPVLRFVRRNMVEAVGVGLADRFGVDWVESVCGGVLEL
jgi:hypothetical protein